MVSIWCAQLRVRCAWEVDCIRKGISKDGIILLVQSEVIQNHIPEVAKGNPVVARSHARGVSPCTWLLSSNLSNASLTDLWSHKGFLPTTAGDLKSDPKTHTVSASSHVM